MMVRKCRDDGANGICAVVPYMGYSRQDRAFLDGEVISMAVIAKLLEDSGVQQIQTVDIHSLFALSHFKIKTQNITSIPLLANFVIEKLKLQKPMVVSPDAGGLKRAEEFAKILKTDVIALEKNRDRITGNVSINQDIDIDLTDRAAVIIDDMISSGGSIIKACQLLKKKGAEKVYAMCTHGLLLGDAKEKIMSAGIQDIISTNSIPNETAKVDLSSIITSSLRAQIQVQ
jgi:ribose-phosphate pyrophosphokinase